MLLLWQSCTYFGPKEDGYSYRPRSTNDLIAGTTESNLISKHNLIITAINRPQPRWARSVPKKFYIRTVTKLRGGFNVISRPDR